MLKADPKYREQLTLLYLKQYLGASHLIRNNSDMFSIDASVSTVYATIPLCDNVEENPCLVPSLLHSTLPASRLIIIMRNPIARLWSDYWYFCSRSEWKWTGDRPHIPARVMSRAPEIFHYSNGLSNREL